LSLIGIIYGGLVAMVQPDFKKLIAYSSVAHLGFVMLGIWALTLQSVQGALLVMINHGISTGALFFLVGMIYERRHSRLIEAYGGIARVVPLFAAILTIVSLSSIALPGTNGFVGEFLVLIGSFRTYPIATAVATTGVIIAAAYLLTALQRVIYNPLTQPENEKLTDLTPREIAELVLTGWALVLLLFVAWRHRSVRDLRIAGVMTLIALASTAIAIWWLWWNRAGVHGVVSMIAADDFRWVADWVFVAAAALTVLISFTYLEREQLLAPEYYVLLLFGTIGMMVMAAGADLMVIFLGLELMSVAVYVLAGFDRRRARSAEAALKYFLLGAFASGFLLYGIALVYCAT